MKGFNIVFVILSIVFSCKGQSTKHKNNVEKANQYKMISFGDKIDSKDVQSTAQISERYRSLRATDTLQTKFTAKVKEVCKVKGCWMTLALTNGEEAMVRFKDYGFFMPVDISGKEVIVNGFAFVEETSVRDLKHFAEDGGKSKEEIKKISKPKKTYGFEADGVLLKQ